MPTSISRHPAPGTPGAAGGPAAAPPPVAGGGGSGAARTPAGAAADTSPVARPVPAGAPTSDSFTVTVRSPGGRWQSPGVYRATLGLIDPETGTRCLRDSSVAIVDVRGPVEVAVTAAKAAVLTARVRPDSYGITPAVLGSTVVFTLDRPRNVVVQVDGEVFDCLHLLARPLEDDAPAADDPDVLRFGPGLHTVSGGVVQVRSGQTVHLDSGAVLAARVRFADVHDARLTGRGVIWAAPGGGVTVERSRNVFLGAVTVLNPDGYAVTVGQSEQVVISGLASFSSKVWGDGIDVFSSTGVTVDRVFLRNSDDCVAVYGHRWDYRGHTRDITVTNSTLWADVAHPVNVGTHGDTADPGVLDGLVLRNIDILDHHEPQLPYQGCIALNAGDSNLISNVHIEDVRVEDFRRGQLINMRVMHNSLYNTSPGRGIDTVLVRNLTYTGTNAGPSVLAGYDANRPVTNVTFENLVVNGTVIADSMAKPSWYLASDRVPMHVNEHVRNLRFLTSSEAQAEAGARPSHVRVDSPTSPPPQKKEADR